MSGVVEGGAITRSVKDGVTDGVAMPAVGGGCDADTLPVPLVEGVHDRLAPLDSEDVGDAVGVELALVVIDGVAGGVSVAEPVPVALRVCVGVPVALPVLVRV